MDILLVAFVAGSAAYAGYWRARRDEARRWERLNDRLEATDLSAAAIMAAIRETTEELR